MSISRDFICMIFQIKTEISILTKKKIIILSYRSGAGNKLVLSSNFFLPILNWLQEKNCNLWVNSATAWFSEEAEIHIPTHGYFLSKSKKTNPKCTSGNNGWFYSADNKFAPLQAEDANPRQWCRTSFPVMGRPLDFTSLTVTLDTCRLITQPQQGFTQCNAASVVTALTSSSTACSAACIFASPVPSIPPPLPPSIPSLSLLPMPWPLEASIWYPALHPWSGESVLIHQLSLSRLTLWLCL